MRITLIQTDIKWAAPLDNAIKVEKMLADVPRSDLYVLPEMWSTGFVTEPESVAEKDGCSLQWMLKTSERLRSSICGSLAIEERDKNGNVSYRNRLYYVSCGHIVAQYDKHHLFTCGGEHKFYTPGKDRVVVKDGDFRWLLLTCYDLRFPVWSRYRGDYDGIIIVANWPESRKVAWDTLIRARAIENQCYVVAVNRVGADERCNYVGGSAIINAKGMTIAKCTTGLESTKTAEICLEELNNFRNKFAVLEDRDEYEFNY